MTCIGRIDRLWKFSWILGGMPGGYFPVNTQGYLQALREIVLGVGLPTLALGGDGSSAPSYPGLILDGSQVPLGSTAAHNPASRGESPWIRP